MIANVSGDLHFWLKFLRISRMIFYFSAPVSKRLCHSDSKGFTIEVGLLILFYNLGFVQDGAGISGLFWWRGFRVGLKPISVSIGFCAYYYYWFWFVQVLKMRILVRKRFRKNTSSDIFTKRPCVRILPFLGA